MIQLDKQNVEANEFIKKNKKILFEKFASDKIYKPRKKPISLFMAGSPGAGKTEYSKALIETAKNSANPIVRIDADEIREMIPLYNGHNSDVVQRAASTGVHKLYDYILKHTLDAMIDGTFAKFEIAYRNVKRSLDRSREVGIYYIYQDPLVAWEFTKKREKLEGRRVPRKVFVNAFFDARINVVKIKSIFKNKIKLYLVIKNYSNNVHKFYSKIDRIDKHLKDDYTKAKLNKLLKNQL
ncbi:zeta toxin family protein [Candidatus Parcubacteria bacterium]|nr:zeta toxin family protein [Candidatus Parcubacteria bacterium]